MYRNVVSPRVFSILGGKRILKIRGEFDFATDTGKNRYLFKLVPAVGDILIFTKETLSYHAEGYSVPVEVVLEPGKKESALRRRRKPLLMMPKWGVSGPCRSSFPESAYFNSMTLPWNQGFEKRLTWTTIGIYVPTAAICPPYFSGRKTTSRITMGDLVGNLGPGRLIRTSTINSDFCWIENGLAILRDGFEKFPFGEVAFGTEKLDGYHPVEFEGKMHFKALAPSLYFTKSIVRIAGNSDPSINGSRPRLCISGIDAKLQESSRQANIFRNKPGLYLTFNTPFVGKFRIFDSR